MTTLANRDWAITVGTVRIGPGAPGGTLTCRFEISKSLEREPNKASLKIYNLSERRRNALIDEAPQLQIVAGYMDLTDTLFVGDTRDIGVYRDGVDTITEMEAEDGGTSYRTATIQRAFGPGVSVSTVIRACAEAMGVGMGNTLSIAADAELASGGNIYATGTTLSGVAWRQLNRICTSASLRWSVQNGVLQLQRTRHALERPVEVRAIRLAPGTGLLGSPTRGKRDDRTGRISFGAKALLIPGLYPGRVVRIEARMLQANLMIRKVRYIGDTTGDDWIADMELQEYDA